jgi:putative tricarboxylic transport membrane protein
LTFREVDIAVGTILALVGVWILLQSLQLDFYVERVPGPGFFPTVLGILLVLVSGALVVTRLRGNRERFPAFSLPTRGQSRRSLGLWLAILAATFLVGIVGFLPAMLSLVGVIMLGIEGRRGVTTIVTIVLTPLLAYLLFGQLLQVRLPTGLWGS